MIVDHAATIAHQSQRPRRAGPRLAPSAQTMQIAVFFRVATSTAPRPALSIVARRVPFGKNETFLRRDSALSASRRAIQARSGRARRVRRRRRRARSIGDSSQQECAARRDIIRLGLEAVVLEPSSINHKFHSEIEHHPSRSLRRTTCFEGEADGRMARISRRSLTVPQRNRWDMPARCARGWSGKYPRAP